MDFICVEKKYIQDINGIGMLLYLVNFLYTAYDFENDLWLIQLANTIMRYSDSVGGLCLKM